MKQTILIKEKINIYKQIVAKQKNKKTGKLNPYFTLNNIEQKIWDEVKNDCDFYVYQAMSVVAELKDEKLNCQNMNKFAIIRAPNEIRDNKELFEMLMEMCPLLFVKLYNYDKLLRDKDIIIMFLSYSGSFEYFHKIRKDNRITVAYEICKIFPLYEIKIGNQLKSKIGNMRLIEYVERNNLKKRLHRELPKAEVIIKRVKI